MSTKAIREVLSLYARHAGPGTYGEAIQKTAVEEVEAIEKAATAWVEVDGLHSPGRMKRLDDLMRSIAGAEVARGDGEA